LHLILKKIDGLRLLIESLGLFLCERPQKTKKQQFSLGYPKIAAKIISLNIFSDIYMAKVG